MCRNLCCQNSLSFCTRLSNLGEDLCRKAKAFVKDEKKGDFSALDWHLAASGLSGSISEIRDREYKVPAGSLSMRPVSLKKEIDRDWRTWQGFTKVVKHLN